MDRIGERCHDALELGTSFERSFAPRRRFLDGREKSAPVGAVDVADVAVQAAADTVHILSLTSLNYRTSLQCWKLSQGPRAERIDHSNELLYHV